MRLKKQSMRQLRDAAAIERASGIVANVGDVALEKMRKRTIAKEIDRPIYVRGALVRTTKQV